jgi:hydroxymethylbilane synthase
MKITGIVAERTGRRLFRDEVFGLTDQSERLGEQLAERLLEMGAGEILTSAEMEDAPPGTS